MFELTSAEKKSLLVINKKILYNANVKRYSYITKIMKIVERDNYLSKRDPNTLTIKNKEEMATFEEAVEEAYTKMVPFTDLLIYHQEIKKVILGTATDQYINPLEVYKYYVSRGNRLTLVKLFIMVGRNNAKFIKNDIGTLTSCERLLGSIDGDYNVASSEFINIFTNYISALEQECHQQPVSVIDIRCVHRLNKELVTILTNHLLANKAELETSQKAKKITLTD